MLEEIFQRLNFELKSIRCCQTNPIKPVLQMQSNKTTENAGNRWIHHLYLNTKLPQTWLVIQTWNVYEKHWKTRVKHKIENLI